MSFVATYPASSRGAIHDALMSLLRAQLSTVFVTIDDRLKMWNEVPPELQPALYVVTHYEPNTSAARGLPQKRTIDYLFFIYASVPLGGDAKGVNVLNALLDSVDDAITPPVGSNVQMLNGIVYRMWNEGEIIKDPGDIDGQALAIMPIRIRPP